ncbi:MAG: outer membrane lipoprotein carrier protein LolA [Flavobacteriaceae bacterium]|nr:outer membrane lipoprotein carrier protein LolA [Flavobacteriaceae bacterium]
MNKKVILLIFLLITSLGFSQNAKTFLDDVAKKVQSYDDIYIEFEHKLDNSIANIHQETRGNATLKDDMYHFNYMGIEQLYDGDKVYMIIHEDEEVIVKQPNSEDEDTITPSKFLTFYEKGFTYKMDILQNVKGRKIQYVKLIPIDSDSDLKYILLGIDNVTKHIYKVIETGKDDTVTTVTISKFATNQSISNKLFTFDKSKFEDKGYDITEPK